MAEYRNWRNESYRYSGSDKYPWPQDVLYHICIEMRRSCVERQLTEAELGRLAERLLSKWTRHVGNGMSIPPIRRQLAAPHHPAGPTPAQLLNGTFTATVAGNNSLTWTIADSDLNGSPTTLGQFSIDGADNLVTAVNTFFAQGNSVGTYLLELGVQKSGVSAEIAALKAYLEDPLKRFYA